MLRLLPALAAAAAAMLAWSTLTPDAPPDSANAHPSVSAPPTPPPARTAPPVAATARPTTAVVRASASGELVRTDTLAAAGTRRPARIALVEHGLRCPDGRHLPLLNGVTDAPAIARPSEHGPVPPVVAILTDAAGFGPPRVVPAVLGAAAADAEAVSRRAPARRPREGR